MSAAQFYARLRQVLDHHDRFRLFACSLQDQVISFRLLNGEHLDDSVIISLHDNRQLSLAHLAFKLLEIVVEGAPNYFLLHLDVDPLQQALQMNCPTGA